jgi:hypothetical protein
VTGTETVTASVITCPAPTNSAPVSLKIDFFLSALGGSASGASYITRNLSGHCIHH